MLESWKIIIDFPEYAISNMGQVKRLLAASGTQKNKILKPSINSQGYFVVNLCKNGVRRQKAIHRLVLDAFVGPCPESMQCNHKDGIKAHNNIDNLEWVTSQENIQHAFRLGLIKHPIGENQYNSKLKNNEVRKIRKMLANRMLQREIAVHFGVARSTISLIAINQRYQAVV